MSVDEWADQAIAAMLARVWSVIEWELAQARVRRG